MDTKPPQRSTPESSPPPPLQHSHEHPAPIKDAFLPHWDSVDACNAPGNAAWLARRKTRKEESLFSTLRAGIVEHQIGLSVNLLLLLALTHIFFPRARQRTRSFFQLCYFDPTTNRYFQGPEDFYFVFNWIVIFTGLRAATMSYILLPFAQWAGVDKTKTKVRFAEQAWLFLYYSVFWTLGMYLFYNSPYWLNLRELWTNFPTRTMTYTMKWYYLVQFAFWLQQIVIVHIEERRKDHWQMFTHHIVTCALMFTSYGYYQTKVGNAILCIMDIVDLTLPAAKMLKYTGYQKLCDFAFGVFILSWVLARHVCYLMICWSIYVHSPEMMDFGCYSSVTGDMITTDGGNEIMPHILQPFTNPGGAICFNLRIHTAFLSLLMFLQGITLMWFVMIVRVAWNVIQGNGADDSRSDDEEDEHEEAGEPFDEMELSQEFPNANHSGTTYASASCKQAIEETVGVDGLNLKSRPTTRYRTRKSANGSGLSIAGHSDRKELLGRIGSDKPS